MNRHVLSMTGAMLAVLSLGGCGSACSSDRIAGYRVSGTPYVAQLNRKNCGATTGFVYELFVAREGEDDADLALRFDSARQGVGWPEDERGLVRFRASAAEAVQVQVTAPVRVWKEEPKLGDLQLRYTYAAGSEKM